MTLDEQLAMATNVVAQPQAPVAEGPAVVAPVQQTYTAPVQAMPQAQVAPVQISYTIPANTQVSATPSFAGPVGIDLNAAAQEAEVNYSVQTIEIGQKISNRAIDPVKKLDKGEDFAKLAKDNSDDEGSAKKGGDLGTFTHGKMVDEFEKAAVALKVGKYSAEPVKTSYGYHIILKVSQKDKPALKKVKDDIIEEIAKDNTTSDNTLQVTALVKLREKYDIKWEDTSLKKKYDAYIDNLMSSAKEANNQ